MILVIDNYDSFTYNLVQYLGELGEDVLVRRNDETTLSDIEANLPSRILISRGPGCPADAGISLALLAHFAGRIPMLVFAWAIRPLARFLADVSCVRPQLCTARRLKFFTM